MLTCQAVPRGHNMNVNHLKMVRRLTAAVWALGLATSLTAWSYVTAAASYHGKPSQSPRRHRARSLSLQPSSTEDELARLQTIDLPSWAKVRLRYVSVEGAGRVVM